ncbi:MAG: hypothetical protein LBR24_02735 [Methanobrevibacter sp.]|jgi:hypothetical protein|nr:hypothetical protein [Methanobrevibacter sp.]
MYSYNKHFLDSNILLGNILPSKDIKIYESYFSQDFKKLISYRVSKESINVIFRSKRVSEKLLDFFRERIINRPTNPIQAEITLNKIKNDFIHLYDEKNFPENIKREKFIAMVNENYELFFDSFYQDLISNSHTHIDELKKKTSKDFTNYLKNLNILLSTLNIGTFYFENDDVPLERAISKIGIHKSDKLILLDCYTFSKKFSNEVVAFITSDKGIISSQKNIEKVLSYNFPIFDPKDYF